MHKFRSNQKKIWELDTSKLSSNTLFHLLKQEFVECSDIINDNGLLAIREFLDQKILPSYEELISGFAPFCFDELYSYDLCYIREKYIRDNMYTKPFSMHPMNTNLYYELILVRDDIWSERCAMKLHPDKNSSPTASDEFKDVQEAYEVLSDPTKRYLYDRFGIQSLKMNAGAANMNSFFNNDWVAVNKPAINVNCSLEEIYNGAEKQISFNKTIPCDDCKSIVKNMCKTCKGEGIILQMHKLGPSMFQKITAKCNDCNGKGCKAEKGHLCLKCNGEGSIKETISSRIKIPKGIIHGQPFMFVKDGSDIAIRVLIVEHSIYQRLNQNDLSTTINISLSEALSKTQMKLKFLDNTMLMFTNENVITPNSQYIIRGKGMNNDAVLYIKFNIEFPSKLLEKPSLLNLMPKRFYNDENSPDNIKLETYNSEPQHNNDNNQENVQCRQQ